MASFEQHCPCWQKHCEKSHPNVILEEKGGGGRGNAPEIRDLKAKLQKAGFTSRPGKGSHRVFTHPDLPGARLVLAGSDGDDAQYYQIADVQELLEQLHTQQRQEGRK